MFAVRRQCKYHCPGAGAIGGISTPKERGGYFGMFNLGPMITPCVAPVAGRALSQALGWWSIFWMIVILVAICLLCIALFYPETLRLVAGNGSTPVSRHLRPIISVVGREAVIPKSPPDAIHDMKPKQPLNPFILFTYPDVLVLVTFTSVVFAVNYTVTATISSSFARIYPSLSETVLGLCYLPSSAGMILGSSLTGKLLD